MDAPLALVRSGTTDAVVFCRGFPVCQLVKLPIVGHNQSRAPANRFLPYPVCLHVALVQNQHPSVDRGPLEAALEVRNASVAGYSLICVFSGLKAWDPTLGRSEQLSNSAYVVPVMPRKCMFFRVVLVYLFLIIRRRSQLVWILPAERLLT